MTKNFPQNFEVAITEIKIGNGRDVDESKVKSLAGSIQDTGLLQPIGLNPQNELVYGRHRLEAFKLLKRKHIPAVILDLDKSRAELARIDENLQRNSLSGIDLAEALLRRKELYEELHPQTKHGGDRKTKQAESSSNNCNLIAFADDAAKKLCRSTETIRLYIRVAKRIPADLRDQLHATSVGKKITELESLSSLEENDQRTLVEKIVAGAESVAAACKAVNGEERSSAIQKLLAQRQPANGVSEPDSGTQLSDPAGPVPEQQPADEAIGETSQTSLDPAESDAVSAGALEAETPQLAPTCDLGKSGSTEVNPACFYHEFLLELQKSINFIKLHFDAVVGKGLASSEAVEILKKAANFLHAVYKVELDFMKEGTAE